MMFVQSLRGLSHTKLEDTREEHLELSVAALDRLADQDDRARRSLRRRTRQSLRGTRRRPRGDGQCVGAVLAPPLTRGARYYAFARENRRHAMALSFGVTVLPDPPASRLVELMKLGEDNGFEIGWTYDSHVLWQDSFPLLTLADPGDVDG